MATDREIVLAAIKTEIDRQSDPHGAYLCWGALWREGGAKVQVLGETNILLVADAILAALAKRQQMTTTN